MRKKTETPKKTNLLGEEVAPQPLTFKQEGLHLVLFRNGHFTGTVSPNGWTGKRTCTNQLRRPHESHRDASHLRGMEEPQTENMQNAEEVIRCLRRDGFSPASGIKYCRAIALEIHYGAFTRKSDEQTYLEAARLLEEQVKTERLAEENVADLETLCQHLFKRVQELEQKVLSLCEKQNTPT